MIYDILPINNYKGNNSSTTFDFDFYIDNKNQLNVYHFDENKIKRLLQLDIDYSINEVKNKNGSYITFPLEGSEFSILNEKENLSLELTLPVSQETQYNNSSLLNLEVLEYSFDYLTRLVQILSRKLDLCVKVEECSETTPKEIIDDVNTKAIAVDSALTTVLNSKKEIEDYNSNIQTINQKITTYSEKFDKIDELETNKSNIDLSNLSNRGKKTIDGQWVKIAPIKVSSGLLLGSKATKIFDVSSAVPDDDCRYDLIIKVEHHSAVGAVATVSYYKDDSTIIEMLSTRSQNANAVSTATGRVVVDKNRKIAAKSAEVSVATLDLYILGYRRLGTNE